MALRSLRESDVDNLLARGGLSITGHWHWSRGANRGYAKIEIPVAGHPSLRLYVTANVEEPGKASFVLSLNNAFRVRGLCMHGSHRNKHTNDEVWIDRTHKHRWTDRCNDRFAYTLTDITATGYSELLSEFCHECGIGCTATLDPAPEVEEGLFDDL
jgi:hypothetical protein